MDYDCGYQVAQRSPTAEECYRIRTDLACVQDPCCRPCPKFEEHKLPPAGMPTGAGETVAETLNWKKPNCVSACDSVPKECEAISRCPPPPPKLVLGPCPPQARQQQQQQRFPMTVVDPCNTRCPYLSAACLTQQRPQQYSVPTRREDALLGFVGGPQSMASVEVVPVNVQRMERPMGPAPPRLMPTVVSGRKEVAPRIQTQKYDCDSKTSRQCENNCPECPIEIHSRQVYPKCESMVPGYGGHVPGMTTCKFGKTFGRETREALQKVYSTPRLSTYPKKC